MGIDRTQYWPNMYQELYHYVNSCVTCQTRNLRKVKPSQQETETHPFAFAKLGLNVSGPYRETLSGNKYMIAFVDWYSSWLEAFPL